MSATTSVIVAGARTPVGKLLGSLKDFSATDLGGLAIKAALERAGVAPEQVQYVIMGQVLTAGAGQIPARQAAHKAGIPLTVPALTINKVCLSGVDAIALADQLIRAGEFEMVVAGGQESMTQAPHLLPKSREGFKYGTVEMLDHMAYDGLWDVLTDQAMGALTEAANAGDQEFSRAEQDAFAARSHQLAAEGWKNGVFDDEVVPVSIPQRKGEPLEFRDDEGVRGRHHRRDAGPAAPGVPPGRHHHRRLGLADLRRRRRGGGDEQGQGRGAGPELAGRDRRARHGRRARTPACSTSRPTRSGQRWPRRASTVADLDLIEINEAFAAVGLASAQGTGRPDRHRQRQRRRDRASATRSACPAPGSRCTWRWSCSAAAAGSGSAALCGGGGQGDALILRVPARRRPRTNQSPAA